MFSVELESLIVFLVDKLLDRKSLVEIISRDEGGIYRRPGLYMSFPVTVSDDDYNEDGENTRLTKNVYLVFTGNTSVWYLVTDDNRIDGKTEDFINSSNHDSCWRSDGLRFLTDLYFKMCKEVNPDKAPINLRSELSWTLWANVDQCEVTYRPNRDGDYGYELMKCRVL